VEEKTQLEPWAVEMLGKIRERLPGMSEKERALFWRQIKKVAQPSMPDYGVDIDTEALALAIQESHTPLWKIAGKVGINRHTIKTILKSGRCRLSTAKGLAKALSVPLPRIVKGVGR